MHELLSQRSALVNATVDRLLGIDTSTRVELREFHLEHPERTRYEPSNWRVLRALVRGMPITSDDAFLDIGCGKGRAVLAAARLPFGRVVGIDLSEALVEIAAANVARMRTRLLCRDVSVLAADATRFEVPDDVTFVYLFNPFTGSTFDRAVERLVDSVDRRPRTLRVLYVNPVEHQRLLALPRVRIVREIATPAAYRWIGGAGTPERFACVYELLPRRG